ncbi:hypothetical protein F5Y15DRAFT_364562 [Xylariaceae sp. FL0016]|nr:hypothetical protein F5Y15DRAFT_364562 [Xylariaceae sp. FL0016]
MEKYHAIHGKDISSFDLISTHRLPTVSAAQALDDLKSDPRRFVSTGLKALDKALNNGAASDGDSTPSPGGIEKGQIVEVWGPPGSGKTAFAMQAAANTLRDGRKVVWVGELSIPRSCISSPVPAKTLRHAQLSSAIISDTCSPFYRGRNWEFASLLYAHPRTLHGTALQTDSSLLSKRHISDSG